MIRKQLKLLGQLVSLILLKSFNYSNSRNFHEGFYKLDKRFPRDHGRPKICYPILTKNTIEFTFVTLCSFF